MNQNELNSIIEKHELWLNNETGGERADLSGADLSGADLRGADLRGAVLRWADLHDADLHRADLRCAVLSGANLRDADLSHADLRDAVLRDADLSRANIDYSCWPLWCGSADVKVDREIYLQLLAHLCAVDVDDKECKAHQQASLELAKKSHRAEDLGLQKGMSDEYERYGSSTDEKNIPADLEKVT